VGKSAGAGHKPNSVPAEAGAVICLAPRLPGGTSDLPTPWDGPSQSGVRLVLLRMGFALLPMSPLSDFEVMVEYSNLWRANVGLSGSLNFAGPLERLAGPWSFVQLRHAVGDLVHRLL